MSEGDWIASTDEEHWDGAATWATREDAIREAPDELCLEPGERFHVGRQQKQSTANLVTTAMADRLAEMIYERELEDMCPDYGEDWLKLTSEEEKDLAARLSAAVEAFIAATPRHAPNFFRVRDVTDHEAPEQAEASA